MQNLSGKKPNPSKGKTNSIKVDHIWTVLNFNEYLKSTHYWKHPICTETISIPKNDQFEFYFNLHYKQNDCRDTKCKAKHYLWIDFVSCAIPELYLREKVKCRLKMFILDSTNECRNNILWNFDVSKAKVPVYLILLESLRNCPGTYLISDKNLKIKFSIKLYANKEIFNHCNYNKKENPPTSDTDVGRKIAQTGYCFTIENFNHLFTRAKYKVPQFIQSSYFPSNEKCIGNYNVEDQFYLRLYPAGCRANDRSLAIGLCNNKDEVLVNFHLSIRSSYGQWNFHNNADTSIILPHDGQVYSNFTDECRQDKRLFSDDKVTIVCTIDYMLIQIENASNTQLLSHCVQYETESCDATKIQTNRHKIPWPIEKRILLLDNRESHYPIINRFKLDEHSFQVKLHKNENNPQFYSLYLHLNSQLIENITYQFRITMYDGLKNVFFSKGNHNKSYINENIVGFPEFFSQSVLQDYDLYEKKCSTNNEIVEKLNIGIEIWLISAEVTKNVETDKLDDGTITRINNADANNGDHSHSTVNKTYIYATNSALALDNGKVKINGAFKNTSTVNGDGILKKFHRSLSSLF